MVEGTVSLTDFHCALVHPYKREIPGMNMNGFPVSEFVSSKLACVGQRMLLQTSHLAIKIQECSKEMASGKPKDSLHVLCHVIGRE